MNLATVLIAGFPEHILLGGILLLVVLEIIGRKPRASMWVAFYTAGAACAASVGLWLEGFAGAPFPGQLSVSAVPLLSKAVILALAVPTILLTYEEFSDRPFHILLLSALYGACLLASSDNFLTLFLGVELLSIPTYVMVVMAFRRPQSAEAALKYLVLGGAASATLLMGASLIFGWTGSLELSAFVGAVSGNEPLAIAGAAMVLVALYLKAAVVPFHTWAPDAYEAASIPVTAFMSTVVKAGILLAAVRLFDTAELSPSMVELVAILPLVSIVWGNLAAMRQQSFRRMVAYSSIAHAGYLFYAFLGEGAVRFEAVAFYLLAYGVMNVLAFASIPPDASDVSRDRLENLKGLFHRRPYAAIAISIAMLSLAGLPPFPGFIAKFLIFKNAIAAGHTLYAVLGLVGSYIGIYFYLRVVQYLFMSEEVQSANRGTPGALALGAGAICLIAGLVMAILPGWVLGQL
jgi:NADH-quinone oxidoreductase subunit N